MVAAQVFGGLVELADETLIERLLDVSTLLTNFLVASLKKLLFVLVDIFFAGLRGQTLDQMSRRLLQLGKLHDLITALTKSIHVSLELSYVDITLLKKVAGICLLLLRQSLRRAMTVIFQLSQQRIKCELFALNSAYHASKSGIAPIERSHLGHEVVVRLRH